jgi:Mediator of RNA polymerase II transcription subunit 1
VVDIDFATSPDSSIPAPITRINVSIPPADDMSISSLGPAAAEVLTENFRFQDGNAFVKNLTNLARWDGCSEPPGEGLNCFAVLRGLEDALELIFQQERKFGAEDQIISRGWGKPTRNQRHLVGLHIQYSPSDYLLIGTEARRAQYVHQRLQTVYLSPDAPFTSDDIDMFTMGMMSEFVTERPDWIDQNMEQDINAIHDPACSFVMELSEGVVMSVESAKKICEIIGYVGWTNLYGGPSVRDEWTSKDTMLEGLMVFVLKFIYLH